MDPFAYLLNHLAPWSEYSPLLWPIGIAALIALWALGWRLAHPRIFRPETSLLGSPFVFAGVIVLFLVLTAALAFLGYAMYMASHPSL